MSSKIQLINLKILNPIYIFCYQNTVNDKTKFQFDASFRYLNNNNISVAENLLVNN